MLDRRNHIEEVMDAMQSFRKRALIVAMLKKAHITPSQWLVVSFISQNEGASVNETARALSMSGSAATQLINGLVAKGYVKREADKEDRRAQKLFLSEKSRKKIAESRKKRIDSMLKIFEVFTDEEFEQYRNLNRKLIRSFKQ